MIRSEYIRLISAQINSLHFNMNGKSPVYEDKLPLIAYKSASVIPIRITVRIVDQFIVLTRKL